MINLHMKAPQGVSSSNIEGQQYIPNKKGIIKVLQGHHVETLRRHGYVETDAPNEEAPDFDAMEDQELITYIEEHGGDADDSMSSKKLRRLAKQAYTDSQEG